MNQIRNNTTHWLKAAGIRAIKTFAQTMIATIGTTAIIQDVDLMRNILYSGVWQKYMIAYEKGEENKK